MNQVFIQNFDPKFHINLKAASSAASKILKVLKYRNVLLSIAFVSDQKIRKINYQYLNHNWATDVLAFSFRKPFLGEVLISPARAKAQSKRFNSKFSEELARYVCHGILHLHGYNDKFENDKKRMKKMEDELLKLLKSAISLLI